VLNKHFGSFYICIKINHLILQLSIVQMCDGYVGTCLFCNH